MEESPQSRLGEVEGKAGEGGNVEGQGRIAKNWKWSIALRNTAELCSQIGSEQCPLFAYRGIIVDLIRASSEE